MTSLETKKELSEEYGGIKYILTSGMRSKLLLAIYENPKKLDDLRSELKKPSATILHGLKELETINLIKKVQKNYELTSNGYLLTTNMIKLIENWYTINKDKAFWNSHDLSGIPDELLKEIYLLKNAEYITSTTSDLSNAFNTYIQLISKARTLKIILPIYSENHFKHLIKLLKKNKLRSVELIVSEEILSSIKENKLFKKELLDNEKVKVNCMAQNLKIFLTYGDTFMSISLFFNDGHYDDSKILIAKDDAAKKWAKDFINNYKNMEEIL
jgi:predicted transcriptional regulator